MLTGIEQNRQKITRIVRWIALGALALAGVMLMLRATTLGAGISPDSTVYISMARAMLIPFGFQFVVQSGGDFPPFYPALLAIGGAVSGDPATAARWINALLFGCNIALVGVVLDQLTRRSFWVSLFGAALMLSSVTMLTIHAMAWSEPTFLFFGLTGMIALARFIKSLRFRWLVVAAPAMGLAAMDRYVGISLAFTGIVALIFLTPTTLRRKIGSAVFFAAVACMPLALWMTHQPTRRVLAFQLPPREYFQTGFANISVWIVPAGIPILVLYRPWIIAGLALVLALGIGYVWYRKTRRTPVPILLARFPPLLYIVTLFGISYSLVNLLAKVFFGPSLELHPRALSPLFVVGLILFLAIVSALVSYFRPQHIIVRVGIAVFALGILWYSFGAGLRYVERTRLQGLGYAAKTWQASPTIARIKTLPADLVIYSNGSDAIYFLTGRHVSRLPDKVDKMNLIANQIFLDELAKVGNNVSAGRAVIVYMNNFPDRWYQPNEQDLTQALPLHLVARQEDGAIFR